MRSGFVSMTALSVFHNAQIVNRRPGAQRADTVETGDPFEAPWTVAQDLVRGGLAEVDDDEVMPDEPGEAMEPHPSISAPDLKRINTRRKDRAAREDVDPRSAVTGFELSRPAPVAAVTADALHPTGSAPSAPAPTGPVVGTPPKPPEAPVTAAMPSPAKSNVPAVPPAPGVAG